MADSTANPSDGDSPDARHAAIARRCVEAIDFESPARSAFGAWLRVVAVAGSLYAFVAVLRTTVAPLMIENRIAPLNGDSYEGYRFGLPLEKRQAIFAEIAAVEVAERKRAIEQNTWQGHAWSREDDRGHYELQAVHRLAKLHGVSLTHVYLILDEGIRAKWPGPDGEPLLPTTPPQDPRSTW